MIRGFFFFERKFSKIARTSCSFSFFLHESRALFPLFCTNFVQKHLPMTLSAHLSPRRKQICVNLCYQCSFLLSSTSVKSVLSVVLLFLCREPFSNIRDNLNSLNSPDSRFASFSVRYICRALKNFKVGLEQLKTRT